MALSRGWRWIDHRVMINWVIWPAPTFGPQVIEGFHGVRYDAPIARTRELVEICRKVWRRERLEHQGRHYQIPLPAEQGTGLGKALKLINQPVRERIPIVIAAIGPRNVAMTAEIAEGWEPIFYLPVKVAEVWGDALTEGMAGRLAAEVVSGKLVELTSPATYASGFLSRRSAWFWGSITDE